MIQKEKNTREKELKVRQYIEKIKKLDEMTLNAIKYALITYGILFIIVIIGYIWQQHLRDYVGMQFQPILYIVLGVGLLIDARWCKKCYNNISRNHVILRLYAMIFTILFIVGGGCIIFYCADMLL